MFVREQVTSVCFRHGDSYHAQVTEHRVGTRPRPHQRP